MNETPLGHWWLVGSSEELHAVTGSAVLILGLSLGPPPSCPEELRSPKFILMQSHHQLLM